jgi:hypothetical protein
MAVDAWQRWYPHLHDGKHVARSAPALRDVPATRERGTQDLRTFAL